MNFVFLRQPHSFVARNTLTLGQLASCLATWQRACLFSSLVACLCAKLRLYLLLLALLLLLCCCCCGIANTADYRTTWSPTLVTGLFVCSSDNSGSNCRWFPSLCAVYPAKQHSGYKSLQFRVETSKLLLLLLLHNNIKWDVTVARCSSLRVFILCYLVESAKSRAHCVDLASGEASRIASSTASLLEFL